MATSLIIFQDQFLSFLNSSNGRDKFAKLLQYGSRLLSTFLENNSDLLERAKKMDKLVGNQRRLQRLFNELKFLDSLRRIKLSSLKFNSTLDLLSNFGFAIYFFWDHLLWLAANGIIDNKNLRTFKLISGYGWLLGLLALLIKNTISLKDAVDKLRSSSSKPDSRQNHELRWSRDKLALSYFRIIPDIILSLSVSESMTFSDRVTGIAGVIAALHGFWELWPNSK